MEIESHSDLERVYRRAFSRILQDVQFETLMQGKPPDLDKAREFWLKGLKEILDVIEGQSVSVDDHVTVKMVDRSGGQLVNVCVEMDAKTPAGETLIQLFGGEGAPSA